MHRGVRAALLGPLALLASCTAAEVATSPAAIDAQTVVNGQALRDIDAPANAGDWLSHGRGWDEGRFSPLAQINEGNVGRLGLAWFDDLETYRGVQATPLAIDGVLYNESIFNVVTAYDGATGAKLSHALPPPPASQNLPCQVGRAIAIALSEASPSGPFAGSPGTM